LDSRFLCRIQGYDSYSSDCVRGSKRKHEGYLVLEAAVTDYITASLVRITGADRFGSGLIISETDILTAGHVVTDAPLEARLTGQVWSGVRRPIDVTFHPETDFDVALLHLDPSVSAPSRTVQPLPDASVVLATVGDELSVLGFGTADRDLEQDRMLIALVDGFANVFTLNRAVPPGFSGGVITIDRRVAGLIFARDFDKGRSYAYPIQRLIPFIHKFARGAVKFVSEPAHWLRKYPLGPAVFPSITIAKCRRLIEAFVQLYKGTDAISAVGAANEARMECGPPSGDKGLLNSASLADPHFAPALFWQSAFTDAGLKSPRMLAALVSIPEDDSLNEQQRRDRAKLLAELEKWHGN
jgi:hypothetical protein